MTSREFTQKCKSLNKQYFTLFGVVPCPADYAATQNEFFEALQNSVSKKIAIDAYLKRKATHFDGRME